MIIINDNDYSILYDKSNDIKKNERMNNKNDNTTTKVCGK